MFLLELNLDYDLVRGHILGKERLPSIFEVFYIAWGEKTRLVVMMDEPSSKEVALLSGMASKPGAQTLAQLKKERRTVGSLIVRNLATPKRLSSSYMGENFYSSGRTKVNPQGRLIKQFFILKIQLGFLPPLQ